MLLRPQEPCKISGKIKWHQVCEIQVDINILFSSFTCHRRARVTQTPPSVTSWCLSSGRLSLVTLTPQNPGSPEIERALDTLAVQTLRGLPMQLQSPGQAGTLLRNKHASGFKDPQTLRSWVQILTLPLPVHIRAPSSPRKQSTSKSPSSEAALGCGACA